MQLWTAVDDWVAIDACSRAVAGRKCCRGAHCIPLPPGPYTVCHVEPMETLSLQA